MASLKPTIPQLGNTSYSSLFKSAKSIQDTVASNQDAAAASVYELDHSDAAYQTYSDYLKSRINQLLATGSTADNTRAITMQNKLYSAQRSNVSFNIKNASIAVMAGTGTLTDKYNLLSKFYVQAANNGDIDLAQSLESQAYSTYQQIQYQAQQAADARASLAKMSGSSTSSAQKGVATALIDSLKQFNYDYSHAGQKYSQKSLDSYLSSKVDPNDPNSKTVMQTLNDAGVYLKPGATLNYFSIADGVSRAVFKAYTAAHDAIAPYDPSAAGDIAQKAQDFLGKIPTIAGDMNAQQVVQAIVNPLQFSYKADPDFIGNRKSGSGADQNAQVGFKYDYSKDAKGNPVGVTPVYSPQPWVDVPMKINDVANKLGLKIIGNADGNAIEVAAGKNSPDWMKKILGSSDATTHLIEDQNGNINFEADATNGTGMAKYLIQGNISNGKYAVHEWSDSGYTQVARIGFNTSNAGNISVANTPHYLANGSVDRMFGVFNNMNNFGSINNMVANAGIRNQQVITEQQQAAANAAAAKAMLAYTPPPLPQITQARPTPLPQISQPAHTAPMMPSYPVAPVTANPQRPMNSGASLGVSQFNIQGGGGFRLQ